jgi:hypothetical protein
MESELPVVAIQRSCTRHRVHRRRRQRISLSTHKPPRLSPDDGAAQNPSTVLTKTRYILHHKNYSPIIRESTNEAIRREGNHGNKTASGLPVSTQRSSSRHHRVHRRPRRRLALHAHASLASGHALLLLSLASPSPKSQVTRIPHAACDNGSVYIEAGLEGKERHVKRSGSTSLLV